MSINNQTFIHHWPEGEIEDLADYLAKNNLVLCINSDGRFTLDDSFIEYYLGENLDYAVNNFSEKEINYILNEFMQDTLENKSFWFNSEGSQNIVDEQGNVLLDNIINQIDFNEVKINIKEKEINVDNRKSLNIELIYYGEVIDRIDMSIFFTVSGEGEFDYGPMFKYINYPGFALGNFVKFFDFQ